MKDFMRKLRIGFTLSLFVVIAIVVLQNMAAVETNILFYTIEMPRAILLALTAFLGFCAGLMVALRR